jgi:hypothetical protein
VVLVVVAGMGDSSTATVFFGLKQFLVAFFLGEDRAKCDKVTCIIFRYCRLSRLPFQTKWSNYQQVIAEIHLDLGT